MIGKINCCTIFTICRSATWNFIELVNVEEYRIIGEFPYFIFSFLSGIRVLIGFTDLPCPIGHLCLFDISYLPLPEICFI